MPKLHRQHQALAVFRAYTAHMPVMHGREEVMAERNRRAEVCVPTHRARAFCARVRLSAPAGHRVSWPRLA